MTQDEKQLHLADLCARLPYGVKAQVCGWDEEKGEVQITLKIYSINTDGYVYFETNDYDVNYLPVENVRPYLRPLSSMTEEEKVEYCNLQDKFLLSSQYPVTDGYALYDWLNKKMFDYRGLIPKGSAISTEVFNPYYN